MRTDCAHARDFELVLVSFYLHRAPLFVKPEMSYFMISSRRLIIVRFIFSTKCPLLS